MLLTSQANVFSSQPHYDMRIDPRQFTEQKQPTSDISTVIKWKILSQIIQDIFKSPLARFPVNMITTEGHYYNANLSKHCQDNGQKSHIFPFSLPDFLLCITTWKLALFFIKYFWLILVTKYQSTHLPLMYSFIQTIRSNIVISSLLYTNLCEVKCNYHLNNISKT